MHHNFQHIFSMYFNSFHTFFVSCYSFFINYVKYVSQFKFLNEFFITFYTSQQKQKENNLMFFNFLTLSLHSKQIFSPHSRLFKHNNKFTIIHLPFSNPNSHSFCLIPQIARLQVIFFYYYLSRHTPQQTRYTEEQTKNN